MGRETCSSLVKIHRVHDGAHAVGEGRHRVGLNAGLQVRVDHGQRPSGRPGGLGHAARRLLSKEEEREGAGTYWNGDIFLLETNVNISRRVENNSCWRKDAYWT
eukprot:6190533-Pleurochrysis_carterae.AAC.5